MEHMRSNLRDCVDEQFRSRKPHVTAARPVVFVLYLILSVLLAVSCSQSTVPDMSGEPGSAPLPVTRVIPGVFISGSQTHSGLTTSTLMESGNVRVNNGEYFSMENKELWIVPTERGVDSPVKHENLMYVEIAEPLEGGEFEIPRESLPETSFVMVFMDVEDPESPEPIGIVGLRLDEGAVLEFPGRDQIDGDVSFGEVVFTGQQDIGFSTATLQDNSSAFTEDTMLELQRSVEFANSARMVLNLVRNNLIGSDGSEFFTEGVMVNVFDFDPTVSLSSSNEISFGNISVLMFSHDSVTQAALFRPGGQHSLRDFENNGENSAAKWSASIQIDDFRQYAKPGVLWPLISDAGDTLAEFDLSASLLTDTLGNPVVPLPFLRYTTSEYNEKTRIEQIEFNWRYFGIDGATLHELSDIVFLEQLIEEDSLSFELELQDLEDGNGSGPQTVTYMFRQEENWSYDTDSPGAGNLTGSLLHASIDAPALIVPDGNTWIQIGYRFGLYHVFVNALLVIDTE